jgi:hypothetical protein
VPVGTRVRIGLLVALVAFGSAACSVRVVDRDATGGTTGTEGAARAVVEPGGAEAPGNPFVQPASSFDGRCNGDFSIDKAGSSVVTENDCGTVTVSGAWSRVELEDVGRLVVEADNCTVTAGTVGSVEIRGSGNVLKLWEVTGGVSDLGDANQVTVTF